MDAAFGCTATEAFNLRTDPFERAELEAGDYDKWYVEHAFTVAPAQAIVGQFLQSFQEFPPRQKPGSFSIGDAMQKMIDSERGDN